MNRNFSKTAVRTPIFELRIVIHDQKCVQNEFLTTFGTEMCPRRHAPCFLPLSRAAGSDGATRQDHPSQGHGSSPAAFHQMQRCIPDSRDSIVPGQFSFSPGFDAELPAVPAPQRAMLLPHQLHISTSRKLLECPWSPCASEKTEIPQESNQSQHDRAESPNCAYRRGGHREHASVGGHCERVSQCCCLSSTLLACTDHISSTVMRMPLVDCV